MESTELKMSCESKRANDEIAFFIYQASRNSSSDAHELRYLSGRFYDSEELKTKNKILSH